MQVLLVRHGEAVDAGEARSDGHRWLTERGRRALKGVGGAIVQAGVSFTHVFTSPLVRATQTAEILGAEQQYEGPMQVWAPLAGGTTAQAVSLLDPLGAGASVLVVGHEPLIRVMASHLTGLSAMPGFRTGTACLVEWGGTRGSFRWIIEPDTLRRIEHVESIAPRR